MAMAVSGGRWTRVRTLGRGASGAEVFLAADHDSGELFAVKSAPASSPGAELLRREQGVMAGLRSPHVVPCIGGRAARDGSYQLFLEFAPGGSLADAVARNGGRGLEERAVAAYAADMAAGLAYVHGAGLVHGDVKAQNVVIGGDGRAKLADFGCARSAEAVSGPIGGTPAFMAPEVARGEAQGPPADVWALGCTVIEMATGHAPWRGVDDVLAVVRLIGYTDAVPEVPRWLSADAKDFLGRCLARHPSDRATAAQLLEHPFVAPLTAGRRWTWTPPRVGGCRPRARWTRHCGSPTATTTTTTSCRHRAPPTGSGRWPAPLQRCRTGTPTTAGSTCSPHQPKRRPTTRRTRRRTRRSLASTAAVPEERKKW